MTANNSPDTEQETDTPDEINIPGEFNAPFTTNELAELADEENWELIEVDTATIDNEPSWDIVYRTPNNTTIIIVSQTERTDEPFPNVTVLGKYIEVSNYDTYQDIVEKITTVPHGNVTGGLPEEIREELNYTPDEFFSEDQFEELFNIVEWLETYTAGPVVKRYLHELSLEDLQEAAATIDDIHTTYEHKFEENM